LSPLPIQISFVPFLYSWDSWEVGETGLGSSSALDVLAMMNEQALLDSVPPTPPTRLEGTGWFTEIELRWNGVRSAASYQLKRASTLAGPFVTIADTTALEFTDTGLPSGQIFYYVVSAVGPAGQHADSAPLAVATRTNLAIGKTAATSSTQGGNAPARAVDGLTNTRWESAFSDPQWLRVDLGDDYLVSTFRLRWETASSKSYEVQVSPDGTAWTTAYSTTTGPGGIETHNLATPVEARHIRIYGTQRNTTYGHSLWELEVFGIPANQVIGQATSPQPAVGATNVSRTAALSWLAGQNALMHRVYLGTNLATVTAATPASPEFVGATALLEMNVGMLAAGTTYYWRVDEANAENITTSAVWSFTTGGLPMPPADLSASDVWDRDARLTWSSVPGAASYNLKRSSSVSGPFVTVANTTSLAVTDTALTGGQTYYHVVSAVSEGDESADSAPITVTTRTNLALGKTATTTSVQSGNVPARAIDGLANTRWESQFSDPQWIRIDLGSVFLLDAFRLKWEAASSKSYEIQVSLDDSSWTSIYSTTTGPGGTEKLALTTPAQGRYVRLYGTQRNMIYGHSLWEFEIYGDPALTPLENWRLTWYGNTGNTGNAANTAAPHGNGISNLLVFGLIGPQQNPATAQPSQLPQLVSENNAHRFDFTEPSGVSGISYGADWSATLAPGSWLPLPDLGSGTRHVFEAPSNESRVFMRIVVTNTE
jgi:fibronectin type 3 domain-containing protein